MSHGNQTIVCSVSSCKFNDKKRYCGLEAIEVAPVHHVHSGKAAEESLCSSYERLS